MFVRISDGQVFKDNGKGSFVSGKEELEPGWKTYIGFHNFGKLVNNPLYRTPFVKVFVWTFVYASLTVFLSFAVGLFLAITLDKHGPALPALVPLGDHHPVRDPRLPEPARSGRGS